MKIQNHLSLNKQIELGSFYTPDYLVDRMYKIIDKYLTKNNIEEKKILYFDNACGYGAFYKKEKRFVLSDIDNIAIERLKNDFNLKDNFYITNALQDVNRKKYNIKENDFLINIGNPPYNDTTSIIKSGKKGNFVCDNDIVDRDLGVSFLKSYNKLKSDIICVLHPLSYLIKKSNFERLGDFNKNYKLIYGEIFSSEHFSGTGKTKFPILIAFYERNKEGMDYEYIKKFNFNILNKKEKFILNNFKTTDGFIHKYPNGHYVKNETGIFYYTFRDINSLKRNKDFLLEDNYNAINISIEDLYKYSYLYAFKKLFNPKDLWLYGNLSPLLDENLEKNKKDYVLFSILDSGLYKNLNKNIKAKIKSYYKIEKEKADLESIKNKIFINIQNIYSI